MRHLSERILSPRPAATAAQVSRCSATLAARSVRTWTIEVPSAGASSAYLTVSEIFPLEVRAKAIAVFFAIAQCFGALGPVIYGALIGDGSQPFKLFLGYLLGAAVMILGGLVAVVFGVSAEGRSLEDVAAPLAAIGRGRAGTTRAEGAASPLAT